MPRDDSNRVAMWSVILLAALVLIGAVFLLSQCAGGAVGDGGGGY
jgi:hypothetical protein